MLATVVLASSLYGTALLITSTILPQMQGAMSATQDEIAWAMTFNILATAIVTPMTGCLVACFGEKRVMVWPIGVFTLATLLCGMSDRSRRWCSGRDPGRHRGAGGAAVADHPAEYVSAPPAHHGARAVRHGGRGRAGVRVDPGGDLAEAQPALGVDMLVPVASRR